MHPVFSMALFALSLSSTAFAEKPKSSDGDDSALGIAAKYSAASYDKEPQPPAADDSTPKADASSNAGVPEQVANPDAKPAARLPDAAADGKGKTELTNTYWKLVDIEGTAIQSRAGFRETHLRLLAGTDRLLGQGICSRIGGGYQLNKRKLSFDIVDSKSSPCWPDGPPESALIDALKDTVSYEIKDKDLYLLDDEGVRRAHYRATVRVGERLKVTNQ